MKSRPKNVGSSNAWLDTVPMESKSKGHASSSRPGKSRSSRSNRHLPVWHRPLGQVARDFAVRLAAGAANATKVIAEGRARSKERSRALAIITGSDSNPHPSAIAAAVASLSAMFKSILKSPPAPAARRQRRPAPTSTDSAVTPIVQAPRPVATFVPHAPPPLATMPSTTRPSADKLSPFIKQLYADATKILFYDSSGMGMLWVQSAAGLKHVAGPEAKWYFLTVIKRFEALGEVMTRLNPKYVAMTRAFAEQLLENPPGHAVWREMVADDPGHVARCFAGLDKPQNVVIDIPESSIRRVESSASSTVSV